MPTVLIIDSDAEVAGALSEALGARGVATKVLADGAEGLKAAKDDSPDAIVLCVELSRVSGYSICNKLKKNPELAKIPLILTSDKATEETFEQHKKLKTRAEQYLKKPFEMDQMLGLLVQYIELGGDGEDDVEVSLDDMDVDIEDDALGGDLDAAFGKGAGSLDDLDLDDTMSGGATTVMQLPADFAEQMAAEAARARGEPAATAPTPIQPEPAAPKEPRRSAAQDAEAERLRQEVRQLRQKVQSLERTLQDKEQEFTDRLLEESTRSREGIELKKKLLQMERELEKQKQAAAQAEEKAAQSETQILTMKQEVTNVSSEKDTLTEKIGQLVDKVKSLAAERDQLRAELEAAQATQTQAEESIAQAEQVRAKAKKAVDIAMQLLNESGLVH